MTELESLALLQADLYSQLRALRAENAELASKVEEFERQNRDLRGALTKERTAPEAEAARSL